VNFALAEDARARWQAGFAGVLTWAGSSGGAFLGSFVTPVAGTVVGGMAGAAAGDFIGYWLGGWYYDTFIVER
jgi:membrane protein DedA with SNARE-associated domain